VLNPFSRRGDPYLVIVSMTGVKMGDRLVQVGCAHGGRLAAVAAKVGLSGRAVAVVPDDASAERAQKGAADAGVLVEVERASGTALPLDAEAFDVVVVDDTDDRTAAQPPEQRAAFIREVVRVLRPGGRVVFIGATGEASGLAGLLSRKPQTPGFVASGGAVAVLSENGFRSPRILAERDGLIFVEGLKPR
jgi:ubiquinone/menaquinone biosynthesis C-methylase UbiE